MPRTQSKIMSPADTKAAAAGARTAIAAAAKELKTAEAALKVHVKVVTGSAAAHNKTTAAQSKIDYKAGVPLAKAVEKARAKNEKAPTKETKAEFKEANAALALHTKQVAADAKVFNGARKEAIKAEDAKTKELTKAVAVAKKAYDKIAPGAAE